MVRTCGLNNYSDVHLTDETVARRIVDFYKPSGRCLEPCAGSGAFLKALPGGTDWCEVRGGRDFFDYQDKVDWIVTNPPFGGLTSWMEKSFSVAENVVFLIPLSKLFSSVPRMRLVKHYGGIKTVLYLGSGRWIGFDIGFPFGAVHFARNYDGGTSFVWHEVPV